MVEMRREGLYGHHSERLIDRFLVRAELNKTEELKKRLDQLNVRREFVTNQKRRKLESEQALKAKEEEEKAEKEARKDKFEKLDCEGALQKLLKHLQNPKKIEKVLEMINQLVSENFDFIDAESLFSAFDSIMKVKFKFKTDQRRQ